MNTYLYRWSLRPRPDIRVEVQIEATNVCVARREVDGFLRQQTPGDWRVEGVSRAGADGAGAEDVPVLAALPRQRG